MPGELVMPGAEAPADDPNAERVPADPFAGLTDEQVTTLRYAAERHVAEEARRSAERVRRALSKTPAQHPW